MTRTHRVLIVISFISCLVPAIAQSQMVFQLPGYRTSSAVVADFNQDGNADVVVFVPCERTGKCGRALAVYYAGDGAGNFVRSRIDDLGSRISGPATVGDVTGDGVPDIVLPIYGHGLLVVPYLWLKIAPQSTAVQVADVDRDGINDILVTNGSLDVYRGTGGSGFTQIGSYPGADKHLILGDFNGDGTVDAAATVSTGINLFLGTGNGAFQTAIHTDGNFTSIASGDFNHDGKLDLVAGSWDTALVTVLLGRGDGTFSVLPSSNTAQSDSESVVAADFNRDGKLDVAVADGCWFAGWPCRTNGAVTILLGNGDGTLQLPYSYDSGGGMCAGYCLEKMFMTAGDVDHSGVADLIVLNQWYGDRSHSCPKCASSVAILLANGDGTLRSAPVHDHWATTTSLNSGPNPSIYGQPVVFSATVASVGPGIPIGTVKFTGGVPRNRVSGEVVLSAGTGSFTTSKLLPGTVRVTGEYSGDDSQAPGKSSPITQTIDPAPTATAVTSHPNPAAQGQVVTVTATVTSTFAAPRGTVTFTAGDVALGTVPLNGHRAQLQIASLPVGSTTILATYTPALNGLGGTNFLASSGSMVQVVK